MNKFEKATDIGRIHYPFSQAPVNLGVIIEQQGIGHTTGLTNKQTISDVSNKSKDHYDKRYKVYWQRRNEGRTNEQIAAELGLSLVTLTGKNYQLRYESEKSNQ